MPVVINGTGSIAGANTLTGVPVNGPVFSAWQSTLQGILNAGALTQLNFQSVEFDTASAYSNSTMRFTPQVSGYYCIIGGVGYVSSVAQISVCIYKNGIRVKDSLPSAGVVANVTGLLFLNGTTDYVNIYTWQASGATVNTSAAINQTYFQGFMVRVP